MMQFKRKRSLWLEGYKNVMLCHSALLFSYTHLLLYVYTALVMKVYKNSLNYCTSNLELTLTLILTLRILQSMHTQG